MSLEKQNHELLLQIASMLTQQKAPTQKGGVDMPRKLTYGQGSITKRIRLTYNDESGIRKVTTTNDENQAKLISSRYNCAIYKWYEIQWLDEQGIKHTKTAQTQELARSILEQVNPQKFKKNTSKTKRHIKRFGQSLQEWYNIFRKPEVSKGQDYNYQRCINLIPKDITNKPISQLTAHELQLHLSSMKSDKYRYWTKILLVAFLEIEFAQGRIKNNFGLLLKAEQAIAAERQILSKEFEYDFINLLPDDCKTHTLVYLYTGCRLEEAHRIDESDKDTVNKIIWIKETKTLTKTDKKRNIQYKLRPAYLYPVVENIAFPLPRINASKIQKAFVKASEKLDIKITPHDLRHTYATRCDELGINTETILFHTNKKMTKHYIHENKAKKVIDEFKKLEKKYGN